ncbi:Multidrug resistance-associated protein 1 [Giardia muris]|uniref:Multidrug resistance-associated protein 1 n=1 Tax=Giardia muris TaxID=5742 RepID=A0A4Z1STJ7_GIAMU|nr:Multidrug resistance-associated protein 1 [Giardia muris]|eukprot:TNJ29252.1 Multidrug resistance-associated protein 1 [Giardia muris]
MPVEVDIDWEAPPLNEHCPRFFYYTYGWMRPLIRRARRERNIHPRDIPPLPRKLYGDKVQLTLSRALARKKGASPLWALIRQHWGIILLSLIIQPLDAFLSSLIPKVIQRMLLFLNIEHLRELREQYDRGGVLRKLFSECFPDLMIVIVSQMLGLFLRTILSTICSEANVRAHQALLRLFYGKVLRVSNMARIHAIKPSVVTLINADANSIASIILSIPSCILIPAKLVMILIVLATTINPYALLGLAGLLLTAPVIGLLLYFNVRFTTAYAVARDARIRKATEMINGIRLIKYLACEDQQKTGLRQLREKELRLVSRISLSQAAIHMAGYMTWPAMLISAFLGLLTHTGFTTSNAYAVAYLFNLFARVVIELPYLISSLTGVAVSDRRATALFSLPEFHGSSCIETDIPIGMAIITRGTPSYSWGKASDRIVPTAFMTKQRTTEKVVRILTQSLEEAKQKYQEVVSQLEVDEATAPLLSANELERLQDAIHMDTAVGWAKELMIPSPLSIKDVLQYKPVHYIVRNEPSVLMAKRYYVQIATLERLLTFHRITHQGEDLPTVLQNLDFQVKKGALVGIYGPVGAGKTSLLQAILGELPLDSPNPLAGIMHTGSIAFCSQEPIIFTGTLRDNILFHRELDRSCLKQAVELSCLALDLPSFPNGLDTEIGGHGLTLSGGQKARLALARALYEPADIYLFDDPFSALDMRVLGKVWKEAVLGHLKGREATIIVVSHHTGLFKDCDTVFNITGGTLTEVPKSNWEEILTENESIDHIATQVDELRIQSQIDVAPQDVDSNAANKEIHSGVGAIKHRYYRIWFSAGGVKLFVVYVILWVICMGLLQAGSFTITLWTENLLNLSTSMYLMLFAVNCLVFLGLLLTAQILYTIFFRRASRVLHERMIDSLLGTRVGFFEKNTGGRVLNRLTGDVSSCDLGVSGSLSQMCENGIFVAGSLLAICVMSWPSIIVIVPVSLVFVAIFISFRTISPQLRRTSALLQSPMLDLAVDTFSSLPLIRAYGASERLQARYDRLTLAAAASFWLEASLYRWLCLMVNLISVLVSTVIAVSAIIASAFGNNVLTAGTVLMNGFDIVMMLVDTCIGMISLDIRLASVERIVEYSQLPSEEEGLAYSSEDDSLKETGGVYVSGLNFRYRPDLPLVLKDITLNIAANERVGIIGKTGSGKTSLIASLFRLVEPEPGSIITVSGNDIQQLPLAISRRLLTLIPQDPFLFAGTIRSSLCPHAMPDQHIHPDKELWEALDHVQMRDAIAARPEGLDTPVAEGGENFSLGQRQLLCIARALLCHSRIIVLDEATSQTDLETDRLVQRVIRSACEGRTIIAIAHRLDTVVDFDRIVVLKDGELAEVGSPKELFQAGGLFTTLVNSSTDRNTLLGRMGIDIQQMK